MFNVENVVFQLKILASKRLNFRRCSPLLFLTFLANLTSPQSVALPLPCEAPVNNINNVFFTDERIKTTSKLIVNIKVEMTLILTIIFDIVLILLSMSKTGGRMAVAFLGMEINMKERTSKLIVDINVDWETSSFDVNIHNYFWGCFNSFIHGKNNVDVDVDVVFQR